MLSSASAISKTLTRLLADHDKVSLAVAWATDGFALYDSLLTQRGKIDRAVVGIHFYQTSVAFIREFRSDKRVRFALNPTGVFHPKVFLFVGPGTTWSCVLGSANFTRSAFSVNAEACLLFDQEDDRDGTLLRDLKALIRNYWDDAGSISARQLVNYKKIADRQRSKLQALGGSYGNSITAPPPHHIDLMTMDWDDYREKVEQDHHLDARLSVLEAARTLFNSYASFSLIPDEDRKHLAGFSIQTSDLDWGAFGHMHGAGSFKNRVNTNDPQLSQALDAIPLHGAVLREHYDTYIELYCRGAWRKGIATATRLLAMKRPDYFVCFDSANKAGLEREFGVTIGPHNYARYWDAIVERIVDSEWWNSPRPNNRRQAAIWDGRAAFLDALFYVPK